MKTILAAAAVAATMTMVAVAPATAATYAPGSARGINGDGAFSTTTGVASFTDYFTFTVPSAGELVSASLTSRVQAFVATVFQIDFAGMGATLNSFVSGGVAVPGSISKTGKVTSGSIPADVNGDAVFLNAGLYAVQVSGHGGGNYSGTLTVAPVPLPNSVALFGLAVFGLGVAGAMRKKNSVKSVTA